MTRKEIAKNLYNKMNKEEKDSIIYLFIINCIFESQKAFCDEIKEKKIDIDYLIELVHDYWLDTEIQITKICDILIGNYDKIKSDDFNIYDYYYEY